VQAQTDDLLWLLVSRKRLNGLLPQKTFKFFDLKTTLFTGQQQLISYGKTNLAKFA